MIRDSHKGYPSAFKGAATPLNTSLQDKLSLIMKALRIISTPKHYHNWRYLFLQELLTRLHHSLLAVSLLLSLSTIYIIYTIRLKPIQKTVLEWG